MKNTEDDNAGLAAATGSAVPVPMLVKNGWTVDFDFLTAISEAIHQTEYGQDEGVSHEMIEVIILELNRRRCLRICPPNAEKGRSRLREILDDAVAEKKKWPKWARA